MSKPTPAMEIVVGATRTFRRQLPRLLAYEVFFKIVGFAVIGPIAAWLITTRISTTVR